MRGVLTTMCLLLGTIWAGAVWFNPTVGIPGSLGHDCSACIAVRDLRLVVILFMCALIFRFMVQAAQGKRWETCCEVSRTPLHVTLEACQGAEDDAELLRMKTVYFSSVTHSMRFLCFNPQG